MLASMDLNNIWLCIISFVGFVSRQNASVTGKEFQNVNISSQTGSLNQRLITSASQQNLTNEWPDSAHQASRSIIITSAGYVFISPTAIHHLHLKNCMASAHTCRSTLVSSACDRRYGEGERRGQVWLSCFIKGMWTAFLCVHPPPQSW